jgi:hypothetical protein
MDLVRKIVNVSFSFGMLESKHLYSITTPRYTCETVLTLSPELTAADLQAELGSSPVSSLGVVSDGIASSHSDPLRDRAILLNLLSENALELETLDSSLKKNIN